MDTMSGTNPGSPIAAFIVRCVHIALIGWMIWAPFSNHTESLIMHAIVAPFLMMHWLTSNDTCALTVLEKHLRGLDDDGQSFIHSIVAPIYVIPDSSLRSCVFSSTIVLWFVTLHRLHMKRINQTLFINGRKKNAWAG
jgi:hypothetical protein